VESDAGGKEKREAEESEARGFHGRSGGTSGAGDGCALRFFSACFRS
jgi:hypothetical protein